MTAFNRSALVAVCSLLLAVTAGGCAARSHVQWDRAPAVGAETSVGAALCVMQPLVAGTASPGNVGRDFVAIRADVASRILSTVQGRFPRAVIVDGRPLNYRTTLAGYELATGEAVVAREEIGAAQQALERGATHLLVPTITEWRQMRTDDPIGALTMPHDSVTLTLRLMRLQPPALAGRVTFQNRARLTLNQPAARLLNARFRDVTLQLVSGM